MSTVSSPNNIHICSIHYVLGDEYTDTVTFAPGFGISQQSIGVTEPDAGGTAGVYPFDGMLG